MNLVCKECDSPGTIGRRLCEMCHKKMACVRAKQRYQSKGRTWYQHMCPICEKAFKTSHKDSHYCETCRMKARNLAVGSYEYSQKATGRLVWEHRALAESILDRRLLPDEVIHHIDLCRNNNSLDNLLIMGRAEHAELHRYLENHGAIMAKAVNWNVENCWKTLIV